MPGKTALIAGGTGLIGRQLLNLLLDSERYSKVLALIREGSYFSIQHEKLKILNVHFDRLESYQDQLVADDVFCCLGTTMNKAGSQESFRKVDFDYPLNLAQITRRNGGEQYHLVSSLGASKKSKVFYNRVKGEVEDAIQQLDFNLFHVFRPSLLMGNRGESRPGEDAGKVFFNLFSFLFIGPLRKYKAIDSHKVAKAMLLYASTNDQSGMIIHESEELQEF